MIRSKADVEFHSDRSCAPAHPAINVKVHRFGDASKIAERFKCSDKLAERALEFAWESAQRDFWDTATEDAKDILGNVEVYSEGRSSGWLVVHGLPPVDSWDAVMLAKWRRVYCVVRSIIAELCSDSKIEEDIAANRWAEPNAELYNFVDTKDGKTVCLADVEPCLHCKGK